MTVKVWVTTLYSGEADFKHCKRAILSQKNVEVVHHVIEGLNELDAHCAWVGSWNAVKGRFHMNVKVDADTVIDDDHAFEYVHNVMKKEKASVAQVEILDHITNTMISGLNFFTSNCELKIPTSKVMCDRGINQIPPIHSNQGYFSKYSKQNPIADHCRYASDVSGFHFGVHRGLKNKVNEYKLVKAANEQSQNSVRSCAIKGFELAFMKMFDETNHNYTDEHFINMFSEYCIRTSISST